MTFWNSALIYITEQNRFLLTEKIKNLVYYRKRLQIQIHQASTENSELESELIALSLTTYMVRSRGDEESECIGIG